jgi:hypothetical protein
MVKEEKGGNERRKSRRERIERERKGRTWPIE